MKTIGLIGGISWLSTVEYYRLCNQLVNERLGGVQAARMVIHSFNFGDIKTLTHNNDWNTLAAMMAEAAVKLQAGGADCVLMGVNTMHKVAAAVRQAIDIPFLHIAEVTGDAIRQKGLHKVALLGTKYVMQETFYRDALGEKGIEVMIPGNESDIAYINTAIYEEFGKGIFLPDTRQRFLSVIHELEQRGAQGVIAGCTEIPLLISQQDCHIPLFDTTRIHAEAAVAFALAE